MPYKAIKYLGHRTLERSSMDTGKVIPTLDWSYLSIIYTDANPYYHWARAVSENPLKQE